EERFVGHYPFVRPRLFDVEKPLAGQDIEAGGYDAVIATNVLHATRDVRQALSGCKAALRPGGLLLRNESASRSLFAHLAAGRLGGWGRPEGRSPRLPGAPCLDPESWRRILEQGGFSGARLLAPEARVLGQQVIAGISDGRVWQKATTGRPAAAEAPRE